MCEYPDVRRAVRTLVLLATACAGEPSADAPQHFDDVPPCLRELAVQLGSDAPTVSVAWSPHADFLLVGSGTRLRLVEVGAGATLATVATLDGYGGRVYAAWSPDGAFAVTGSDHTVRLFGVDTENAKLTLLDTFVGPEEFVPVAWSPDGTRAVAGHWGVGNAVSLLSVVGDTLTELQHIDVHDSGSRALLWRDDLVLTGGHDHRVHLLRYTADDDRLRQIGSLPDQGIGVHALSWGPDGDRFARVSSQTDRVSVVTIDHNDCAGP